MATINCDLEGCTMEGQHGHGTDQQYAIPGVSPKGRFETINEYELRLAVEHYKAVEKKNTEMIQQAVIKAREAGLSYSTIGRMFGVTRQAAWEHWAKLLNEGSKGAQG